MNRDRLSVIEIISRCVTLRCPACGRASIVNKPFKIKESCTSCGVLFNREEGFFVGAIVVNIVATEGVILLAYILFVALYRDINQLVLTVLFALAVTFPLVFYHHSWSIWLSFDHLVESLPKPPSA
jgi:uncharacterized protein (DUF983 family)